MPIIHRKSNIVFIPPPSRPMTIKKHLDGYSDCKACEGSGRNSKGGVCYPCSVRFAEEKSK